MKVQDLQGAELDYWVACAEGCGPVKEPAAIKFAEEWGEPPLYWFSVNGERGGIEPASNYGSPSTDWDIAGPIIERERININERDGDCWGAFYSCGWTQFGPTPLIAAMRAYVASKFGHEVPDQPAREG